jgi:hypothetical protein
VYLIVDGMRWDALWEVMRATPPDEIETLSEIFGNEFSRSLYFSGTYSVFPSVTFAANASLVTGVYPAEHGVPGNTYFDRSRAEEVRLADARGSEDVYADGLANSLLRVPNLYQRMGTESVVSFHMYGAGSEWVAPGLTDAIWFLTDPAHYDYVATVRLLRRVQELHAETGRLPRVLTLYWSGLDEASHVGGTGVQVDYIRTAIDRNLRVLLNGVPGAADGPRGLRTYGEGLGSLAFVLTADHGQTDAQRWISVGDARHALVNALQRLPAYEALQRADLVNSVKVEPNGSMAHIYVRSAGGEWRESAGDDPNAGSELEAIGTYLWEDEILAEGLDLVLAASGPDGAYRACLGPAEGCVDAEDYFAALNPGDAPGPDLHAADRLQGLAGVGGDLVLTSRSGYAFLGAGEPASEVFEAVHGNLRSAAETFVPLVVAGPGVEPGAIASVNGILDAPRIVAELAGSPLSGLPAPHLAAGSSEILVASAGSVNLSLTDPNGRTVGRDGSDIPGAEYSEWQAEEGGPLEDRIAVPRAVLGDYTLQVIPEGGAGSGRYSLDFGYKGRSSSLAREAPVPETADTYIETAADLPPEFVSVPSNWAEVSTRYQYRLMARDPEGLPLRFEVDPLSEGMTFDPSTGALEWIPSFGQLGEHAVTLRALDAAGNVAIQRVNVGVYLPEVDSPSAVYADGTVRVTWEAVDGAVSYRVQRVYHSQVERSEVRVPSNEYVDADLPCGTSVSYFVYAVDPLGRVGGASEMVVADVESAEGPDGCSPP